MKISILSIFPEMFEGFINTSIIKKAVLKGLVEIELVDFRQFTLDKHNRVDDSPYGGGAGLVLKYEPIVRALKTIQTEDSYTILMSPVAPVYKQAKARSFANKKHLIIICGHYEGVDERVLVHVDESVSVGVFILTGGEIGAMLVSDSIIRLLDGVISDDSIIDESFEDGLLEYAQYTKPQVIDDLAVPDVLISGHHENINNYRHADSLIRTYVNRPDLIDNYQLTEKDVAILNEFKAGQ